jgi:hypothetical protein
MYYLKNGINGRIISMIIDRRIDTEKAFDWGRTSEEYAKYRDVYPNEFYQRITDRGLCISNIPRIT